MPSQIRKVASILSAALLSTSLFIPVLAFADNTYDGISIDGDFSDWNAIAKTHITDDTGWGIINDVAMIWDDDYIYLYFRSNDQNPNAMTGAGSHYNGKFSIKTDLGRELPFQLTQGSTSISISGVDGAESTMNSYSWATPPYELEIAIPSSALPSNNGVINLSQYLGDTIISGVSDVSRGKEDIQSPTFDGITYDGHYRDWNYYPHETIEYATAGSQEQMVDSQGALWLNDGTFYAHVVTTMPEHLSELGGEFTSAVTIMLNGTEQYQFAPRFGIIDENGNPDFSASLSGLATGTYEFAIFSLDAGNVGNNQINDTYEQYGSMYVTIAEGQQDMEWAIDMGKLTKHLRANAQGTDIQQLETSDVKTISAQWGRLGQKWVTTAGTSTSPWLLFSCCGAIALVGAALAKRKRGK